MIRLAGLRKLLKRRKVRVALLAVAALLILFWVLWRQNRGGGLRSYEEKPCKDKNQSWQTTSNGRKCACNPGWKYDNDAKKCISTRQETDPEMKAQAANCGAKNKFSWWDPRPDQKRCRGQKQCTEIGGTVYQNEGYCLGGAGINNYGRVGDPATPDRKGKKCGTDGEGQKWWDFVQGKCRKNSQCAGVVSKNKGIHKCWLPGQLNLDWVGAAPSNIGNGGDTAPPSGGGDTAPPSGGGGGGGDLQWQGCYYKPKVMQGGQWKCPSGYNDFGWSEGRWNNLDKSGIAAWKQLKRGMQCVKADGNVVGCTDAIQKASNLGCSSQQDKNPGGASAQVFYASSKNPYNFNECKVNDKGTTRWEAPSQCCDTQGPNELGNCARC